LVEKRNFIYIQQDILDHNFIDLETYLVAAQKNHYTITKDFSYRYQIPSLTDIAITIGEVTNTDQHQIIIAIKDNKIKLQGDSFLQIQIDSIADSLATVLVEKNDIKNQDLRYINILNDAQYHQIVYEWNKTEKPYPNKTIHQLFEEQVLKTPDNIAVVYENRQLTYAELNQKANQLAHYLLQNFCHFGDFSHPRNLLCHSRESGNLLLGLQENLIALILSRSEYMIIAILAVLKTGAAYVPINPDYPDERIKYILNDTKTKIVLTDTTIKKKNVAIIAI
jgi:non-ribosomal peptide synthetase component F